MGAIFSKKSNKKCHHFDPFLLETCKQVEIESELLLDRGFREVFEAMQWLVIKEDSSGKFTIGPNGKTLILSNAVQQHDSEAYAYTPEKRVEFDEQRYEKTIYFRWKDFLMDRSGSTVSDKIKQSITDG